MLATNHRAECFIRTTVRWLSYGAIYTSSAEQMSWPTIRRLPDTIMGAAIER